MRVTDCAVQGGIKGKTVGLIGQLALKLGDLAFQVGHVHAFKGFQAVFGGVQLGGQAVHLDLQVGGFGLFGGDIPAVFAHQPVQLLIGDVGDLLLYVFAFHVVSFLPALLFTRVASALAVQFYAMPGMFWGINGYKKCPP